MVAPSWFFRFTGVVCATFTVIFITLLQVAVLDKLAKSTESLTSEFQIQLLGSSVKDKTPACAKEDGGYFCGLHVVAMFSNVTELDTDANGYWDMAEVEATQAYLESTNSRAGNLAVVYEYFHKMAGSLPGHSASDGVPMSLLNKWQSTFKMCVGRVGALCGNYEEREILSGLLPNMTQNTPSERINECRRIISKECPAIFGPSFNFNAALHSDVCGISRSYWEPNKRILVSHFWAFQKYVVGGDGRDPVFSSFFGVFLWFLVIIWFLIIVVEGREIVDWWLVICTMPGKGTEVEVLEAHDPGDIKAARSSAVGGKKAMIEGFRIHDINMFTKIYSICVLLVPRTFVALALLNIGLAYLLSADDTENLILNGITLGFIFEIDELFYSAVVGFTHRYIQTLTKEGGPIYSNTTIARYINQPLELVPMEIAYVLPVVLAAGFFVRRKFDQSTDLVKSISCMCQLEGEYCLQARILGVNTTMNGVFWTHTPQDAVVWDTLRAFWKSVG